MPICEVGKRTLCRNCPSQGMEEIEELSANICLMARIQPADQNSDDEPSYESAFINTHVYDPYALETLARNAYDEAVKQQRFAQKVQQKNVTLTSQIKMYKERIRDIKEIKDAFEQNNVYLDEIERQNDLLKDQLLEASLKHDIELLNVTDGAVANASKAENTLCYCDSLGKMCLVLFRINVLSERDSNFLHISISDMAASLPICLMSKATSTKSWLWHLRLSHLNFGTIYDLTKLDLVDGLPIVQICENDHLCYALMERERKSKENDLGKMKPKADIGVFIGYSETSRGFRIYNHRSKRIMETIHVKFDELIIIASEHDCLEPELQRFNNQNSSDDLMNTPSKEDLEYLFRSIV
ncbi:retrovirus-related pol polyprotein from transposon TNT 1-94 [Tanacetum coccineum]